jgi:hypothetical protein
MPSDARRSRTGTSRLAGGGVALVLAGCAFGPGDPLAVLQPSLDARWSVPAERARPLGFARLASDYELRLTAARVQVGDAELRALTGGGGGGGGGAFDPARPPPGYSLCHGGHCHRDDGALIPYAQVEAELASGGAPVQAVRVVGLDVQREVALLEGLTTELSCDPDCDLERVTVSSAVLRLSDVHLEGVVRDSRSPPRFEGERPFTLSLPEVLAQAPVELQAARELPPRVSVRLLLHPGPRIFDAVDWAEGASLAGEVGEEVRARLETTSLSVEVSRSH